MESSVTLLKIAMTGATGFVGRLLGPALASRGHEVVALARDPLKTKLDFAKDVVAWDGTRDSLLPKAVADVDAVVHLAGENIFGARWTEKRKHALYESRIGGTHRLRDAFRDRQLKLFLTASGVGYYGDRGDEWLNASSAPGTDFTARLCVDWEKAAGEVRAARVIQARFGIVLSRHGGFTANVGSLFRRFGASRLGNCRPWFSWIHGEDLVRLLLHAIETQSVRGPLNVVSPAPVTNAELTRELARVLKVFPMPPVPKFALKLVYGELADVMFSSQRVQSAGLIEFKYPDLKSALREIYGR